MRNPFTLVILLLSITFLQAQDLGPNTFIAHEWGTFTTVQGSDGKLLSGLYIEEEHLPEFVYHHQGFSPDLAVVQKGIYKTADNVTVKMETPVVYFYSKNERSAQVKVNFPYGTISQWYPQRQQGEESPGDKTLDFSSPYPGWIQWDCTVLGQGTDLQINTSKEQETPTWVAPRETDANLVKVNDEVEGFLFYRGVGNFEVPLRVSFENGQLKMENRGSDELPYLFVYENWEGKSPTVWWTGALKGNQTQKVDRPGTPISETQLQTKFNELAQALQSAGLYEKEAASMLNTWHESYFESYGVKVFWVVPDALTSQVLPMNITPKPTELKRVLVGRSEVLTPEFEQQLMADITASPEFNQWVNDRYYLAYKERVADMATVTSESELTVNDLTIYPNPNQSRTFTISHSADFNNQPVKLEVLEMSGREVVFELKKEKWVGDWKVNLPQLAPGSYLIRLSGENEQVRTAHLMLE